MKNYQLKQQIKAAYFMLYNNYLFVLESDNSFFKIYNLKNHNLIKISTQSNYGGGIYLFNNFVIDETLRGYEIEKLQEITLFDNDKYLYWMHNNKFLVIREFIEKFKPVFHLFNSVSLDKIKTLEIAGGPIIIKEDLIISRDTKLYVSSISKNKQLWQQDLSEILKYQHDKKVVYGQIKQVKQYKDSLIVVSDGGIIRLLLETGEILWKNKSYARRMEIVGNIGYVTTSLSLYKIDLETGIDSGYNMVNNTLPDIKWNGKTYWSAGHEVVYHEGFLWYSVYSAGESFITAINPETGNYQWIHHVDTSEKIESPQFHGDKMFILDTGGILHIYEKHN